MISRYYKIWNNYLGLLFKQW